MGVLLPSSQGFLRLRKLAYEIGCHSCLKVFTATYNLFIFLRSFFLEAPSFHFLRVDMLQANLQSSFIHSTNKRGSGNSVSTVMNFHLGGHNSPHLGFPLGHLGISGPHWRRWWLAPGKHTSSQARPPDILSPSPTS